ncbi:hypothetical protein RBU61_08335 [Tissierella sp. MB52-C2]|uniref:hypothetical protein n=1 Tax=Tissierella sp. MB52-C2 TaxID=3070999 RepID=UPI00280BC786|nr:hypothetical protein [Tissierella sp. MB52-C2]WMM26672.1 hypothetical protein RBU61_08335 [Tissierella sp. MB52-C2]
MARPSKIEQHGLEDKILKLRNNDKTYNEIVSIVKEEDNVKLSAMAVKRWLDKHEDKVDEKVVEVIREDKRRVMKTVNRTYDIIQTQLDVSQRVLNKLDGLESISEVVENVSETAVKLIQSMGIKITPEEFAYNIEKSISRNIKDYTMLTREVRENNKFLSDLKSKIYDFQIVQEFINLFIQEFEKYDTETTLKVLEEIAANGKLKWLAEEQLRIRGDR